MCIQARQIGYNGVFSLNWAKSTLRSNSLITYVSGGEGKGEKSEPLYSGWLYAHLPSQSSEYSLDLCGPPSASPSSISLLFFLRWWGKRADGL